LANPVPEPAMMETLPPVVVGEAVESPPPAESSRLPPEPVEEPTDVPAVMEMLPGVVVVDAVAMAMPAEPVVTISNTSVPSEPAVMVIESVAVSSIVAGEVKVVSD